MCDFKAMYLKLFAAAADAVEALEQNDPDLAQAILIRAQQVAEEMYISAGPAEHITK